MNSARSTGSADGGEGDQGSQATGGGHSRFSHSVFQPVSARTSSTLEDEEVLDDPRHYHSEQLLPRQSPREELRLNLDQRAPSHEEINFNFEQKPFELKLLGMDQRATSHEEMSHSRNSLYGDNANAYGNDQKSHKLNSIANNMTSQAMSPGTKMALMDMENSYQNIKPKTPVNQTRQFPRGSGRRSAEDQGRTANMSATRIQRWFRRHLTRRKAGEAAMRRLLDTKRAEKAEELSQKKDYVSSSQQHQSSEQRKRIREEKARQARQDAIQVIMMSVKITLGN